MKSWVIIVWGRRGIIWHREKGLLVNMLTIVLSDVNIWSKSSFHFSNPHNYYGTKFEIQSVDCLLKYFALVSCDYRKTEE